MISPARIDPLSLRGRILTAIVDADLPLDASDIAGIVSPMPLPMELRTATSYLAKVAPYQAWVRGRKSVVSLVAREIGRLTAAGLVAEMIPPHASPVWVELRQAVPIARALTLFVDTDFGRELPEDDDDEAEEEREEEALIVFVAPPWLDIEEEYKAEVTAREALMARVEQGPLSTAEFMGPNPSGALKRTYRRLVGLGAIVAPTQRRPTENGRILVASWDAR